MKKLVLVIEGNGDNRWYFNNKLHREDGPAVELVDNKRRECLDNDGWNSYNVVGGYEWYLDGVKLTEEEFNNQTKINEKLDDHFSRCSCFTKQWKNRDGKLHREDGPAVEYPTGRARWFINGNELSQQEFNNTIKYRFSLFN